MIREPAARRDDDVASPCISICTLDATQTYCTGCLRTLHEIAAWSRMSDDDKRAVIDALAARRERTEAP